MFFTLVVAITATVLVVLIHQWYRKRQAKIQPFLKIPGTKPTFLIGDAGWLIRLYSRQLEYHPGVYIVQRILGVDQIHERDGIRVLWMGPDPIVMASCPELMELVLTSSVSLEKSFEYKFLHRWLGLGLLTNGGPKWRYRRKLLTPSLHFRILEDFLPTFYEQSSVLVKKLASLMGEEYVDVMPLILRCTLDIVCETVMGIRIRAQLGENSEYVTAVHNLGAFFNQRTTKPWLWSDFLYSLSSSGKFFDENLRILHNFTEKVIKEKKELLLARRDLPDSVNDPTVLEDECNIKKRKALMDLMLDMHVNGQHLTEADIREEVDTFMFAGHDTTAMGITYSLYCIGLYPEVQKKIHDELDDIFADDPDRPITLDDVRRMKYLECVLKESQRLFPPVPMIGRKLSENINYKDIFIPDGTTVRCNIISLHRRSESFPNPEVFDPERFTPENARNRHPYAFLPFSAGPRNCIGQKFALLEEKVTIGNILRHFDLVSVEPRDKVHLKIEITLKPAQPVRVKFVTRR